MPPFDPPPFTQAQVDAHFPLRRAPLVPTTFEIGLALSGTVSAGAYTAGVLDYIVEALDAWSAAKAKGDPDAPPHNVAISTIAGASGGAINGAVLLRAASFDFPNGATPANPLFDTWAGASCVTLEKLLAPGESKSGLAPVAFLNTTSIEDQADAILKFGGPKRDRPYLTNPLRLISTIGNVTGLPYRINFRGDTELGLDMTMHADYIRLALSVNAGRARPDIRAREDEYAVSADSNLNWSFLKEAALATSAFPVVFDARGVERTINQLACRAVLVPGSPDDPTRMVAVTPTWQELSDVLQHGAMSAIAVDGGTIDNDPIGIARQELAGYDAHNPRGADLANRAVVLIDPFADASPLSAPPKSVVDLSGQILNLFLQQARYKPEDLALAKDDDTFSRFMIAPREDAAQDSPGEESEGSIALASGKLGGFLGFLDERFLTHDFLLGRYDAFLFLTRNFRVPAKNVVIAANPWTDAQRRTYTTGELYDYAGQPQSERDYLPLIPLVAKLRGAPPRQPVRPQLDNMPQRLSADIDARLDYLFARLLAEFSAGWSGFSGGIARTAAKSAWTLWGRQTIRDRAIKALDAALAPNP